MVRPSAARIATGAHAVCSLKIRKSAGSDRALMVDVVRNLSLHPISGRPNKQAPPERTHESPRSRLTVTRGCHRRGGEKYLCRVLVGASYRVEAGVRRTGLPRPAAQAGVRSPTMSRPLTPRTTTSAPGDLPCVRTKACVAPRRGRDAAPMTRATDRSTPLSCPRRVYGWAWS